MNYRILIRRQARVALQALVRAERVRLTEKIMLLSQDPFDPRLCLRRMHVPDLYAMRVSSFQVVFEKVGHIKIMSIDKC